MTDTNIGRLAYDKVGELEKAVAKATVGTGAVYTEKTTEFSLSSSELDNDVIENFSWNFASGDGSFAFVEVTSPQKTAVNIKLAFNGYVVFDEPLAGGRATMTRGGNLVKGENKLSVILSSNAKFTCVIKITLKGFFTEKITPAKLAVAGDGYFSVSAGGELSVYNNADITRLLTVYGVECGCACRLSGGDFLFAYKKYDEGVKIRVVATDGSEKSSFSLQGAFLDFSARPTSDGAIIYASTVNKLKEITYNGSAITVARTLVRSRKSEYAEAESGGLLAVKNPEGYGFVYGVE